MSEVNLYEGGDRFRLIVSDTVTFIREPEGWDKFMYDIRRDKNRHGFIYEYTDGELMLKFDSRCGKAIIDAEYELNGADGDVTLEFGSWDGVTFDPYITMRLTMVEHTKKLNYTEMGVGPVMANETVRTRLPVKGDVNGDKDFNDNTIVGLTDEVFTFHSKVLQKESKVIKSFTDTVAKTESLLFSINEDEPVTFEMEAFGLLGLDFLEPAELETVFTGATGIVDNYALAKTVINYKAKERGDHTINIELSLDAKIVMVPVVTKLFFSDEASFDKADCLLKIELILKIGEDEEVIYTSSTTDCADDTLDLVDISISESRTRFIDQNVDLQLYLKYTFERTVSNYVNVQALRYFMNTFLTVDEGSYVEFIALTETRYTEGGALLIYEVLDKLSEIITGNRFSFKSNFLGRRAIGYAADGCASKYALTNGKKIRKIPAADAHLKLSADECFNSLDAIFCCGLGFEKSEGKLFFTGQFIGNNLYTTLLIPFYEEAELQIYNDSEELIGTISILNLLEGTGTNSDPYRYAWAGGDSIADQGPLDLYMINSFLVDRDVIVIENREYFYRDIELFAIPQEAMNLKSYEEKANEEILINQFSIGYKKYAEDELNTLDEFNNKQEYLLPYKSVRNKLEKYSDFIASGYSIEFQRRKNFENEENARASYANDDDIFIIALTVEEYEVPISYVAGEFVFLTQKIINVPDLPFSITIFAEAGGSTVNAGTYNVIAVENVGGFIKSTRLELDTVITTEVPTLAYIKYNGGQYSPERSQPFDVVENIIGPNSAYNLRISPKRMLLNWGKWLNSILYPKAGTEVVINTFSKQNIVGGSLQTQFNESETCNLGDDTKVLLVETDNVSLADLNSNEKIFKPTNISFKARMEFYDVLYIRERLKKGYLPNAHGYISFYDLDGNVKKGFIMDMKYNPSIEEVEFELLEKA